MCDLLVEAQRRGGGGGEQASWTHIASKEYTTTVHKPYYISLPKKKKMSMWLSKGNFQNHDPASQSASQWVNQHQPDLGTLLSSHNDILSHTYRACLKTTPSQPASQPVKPVKPATQVYHWPDLPYSPPGLRLPTLGRSGTRIMYVCIMCVCLCVSVSVFFFFNFQLLIFPLPTR